MDFWIIGKVDFVDVYYDGFHTNLTTEEYMFTCLSHYTIRRADNKNCYSAITWVPASILAAPVIIFLT